MPRKGYTAQRRLKDPLYGKGAWAKEKYSLEVEEYLEIVSRPCEVCNESEKPRVCDHNHETGEVRGSLCSRCNLIVGLIESAGIDIIGHAIDYIRWH